MEWFIPVLKQISLMNWKLETTKYTVYSSKGGLAHAILQLSLNANVKDKQSLGLPVSYGDK